MFSNLGLLFFFLSESLDTLFKEVIGSENDLKYLLPWHGEEVVQLRCREAKFPLQYIPGEL